MIVTEFPPFGGGIATYAREMTSALRAAGHEVTVFIPGEPDQASAHTTVQPDGTMLVHVPLVSNDDLDRVLNRAQLFSYRVCRCVKDRLEADARPDVIEIQDNNAPGYYLLKDRLVGDSALHGIVIVLVCHAPLFEVAAAEQAPSYKFPTYGIGRTEKFCLLAADLVISPSHFLAGRLAQFRPDGISVVPLPYNVAAVPVPPPPTRPEWDVLYLGRTQYLKGIVQLLAGMAVLWADGASARLRMVGGDALWHPRQLHLKEYIRAHYRDELENGLLVIGEEVGRDKVAAAYLSTRIAVVPSLFDNFPYTCIEAMSHGVPVLGSREGGHSEMLAAADQGSQQFDIHDSRDVANVIEGTLGRSSEELRMAGLRGREAIATLCQPARIVALRTELLASYRQSSRGTVQSRRYPFVNDVDTPAPGRAPQTASARHSLQRQPLLSVIVIANNASTIEQAVTSVMASDYSVIEVILVDDGPRERDPGGVIAQLGATRQRFPLRVERIGTNDRERPRIAGARRASGELISFLEADQCVLPSYYARAIDVLTRYDNVSYVYSWLERAGKASGPWITFDTDLPFLLGSNMTGPSAVITRSDYLEVSTDMSGVISLEDHETWIRLALAGRLGVVLPELLVRRQEGADTHLQQSETLLWLHERMVAANPEIFSVWGTQLAQLEYANGPGRLWSNFAAEHNNVELRNDGAGYNYRVLSASFSPAEQVQMIRLLNDPAARRIIRAVLASGIHVPVLAAMRSVVRLWPGGRSRGLSRSQAHKLTDAGKGDRNALP